MNILCSKKVKVRKEHRCAWCGDNISYGELVERVTQVDGDRISSHYLHPECGRAVSNYTEDPDDTFSEYEHRRGCECLKNEECEFCHGSGKVGNE